MKQSPNEPFDMEKMIADYMENGLLENIVDMFKYDNTLYDFIPRLIRDERIRVRIGTIALLEILYKEDPDNIGKAISHLIPLLKNSEPVVQGDVAYILGLIGTEELIPSLEEVIDSDNADLRTIVREAIDDIRSRIQ